MLHASPTLSMALPELRQRSIFRKERVAQRAFQHDPRRQLSHMDLREVGTQPRLKSKLSSRLVAKVQDPVPETIAALAGELGVNAKNPAMSRVLPGEVLGSNRRSDSVGGWHVGAFSRALTRRLDLLTVHQREAAQPPPVRCREGNTLLAKKRPPKLPNGVR